MKKRTKKLLAPIVITILVVCYFIFYMLMGLHISSEISFFCKILILVVPIALIVLSIYMLFERIDEIKGGEEDDLSKY